MGFYDWDKIKPEELTRLSRSRIARSENVMLAEVEVRRGTSTPWHSHENEELVIVLKGAWRFYLPSGELTLEANQMLSIPVGVEHSSEVLEDTLALNICTPTKLARRNEEQQTFEHDPDQSLWAV